MCGLVGVVRVYDGPPLDGSVIENMRDAMVHRGPDDSGIYLSPDGKVGLGHRRLSIVDLSPAGKQPMCNEDETVWIVFNGEIYNHLELRHELEHLGHRYKSKTDTETIIHLYEEYGDDCVHKLQGMFSFGIWDSRVSKLLLVRDRIGIKPMYFAWHDECLFFASEIKALLLYPGFPREVDETSVYHYLTFLSTPAPLTLFKGIKKLPAGHRLKQALDVDSKPEMYWDAVFPCESHSPINESDYCENIRGLLSDSIEDRMMSDVPFGVLLSGGVDSSVNVALMDRYMDRPVDTFTVGFEGGESYNEFQFARQVANKFKTNHHEILIGQEDMLSFLRDMVHHQDEPISDPVCFPLYFVSKLARDSGVTVVQVGEGSDELFCGYPAYMNSLRFQSSVLPFLNSLPKSMRKGIYEGVCVLSSLSHRGFHLRDIFRKAINGEELFWGGAISLTETDKKWVLSERFLKKTETLSSYDVIQSHYEKISQEKPESDILERMIYLELKHRLPETLLMRVDKLTMATSVEARVPFLDHRLVEFAMKIPREIKIKNGAKYILKKAVEDLIPRELVYREKQGFAAPVKEWLIGQLGEAMRVVFRDSDMVHMDLFNYERVEEMLSAHQRGHTNYTGILWNIFNLHLWYDHWFSQKETPLPHEWF